MSDFLTNDGQAFASVEAARAHIAERCAQRDGFYICFVQEVRALEGGTWQHFEDFAVPGDHAAKFNAADADAPFCVYNPVTGESTYLQGKATVLTEMKQILATHARHTEMTRIYQKVDDPESTPSFVEVQA